MSYQQRQNMHDQLSALLDEAEGKKNCGTCIYCSLTDNVCNKYNAQPPMKVVLTGCIAYVEAVDDDVPF